MKWRNRTPEIQRIECLIGLNDLYQSECRMRIAHFDVKATNQFTAHPDPVCVELLTPVKDKALADLKRLTDERKVLELELAAAEQRAGFIDDGVADL